MDIIQGIEVLEATGFHLYRRLREGDELRGALMVHTKADLYVAMRLVDDGLWTYLSGSCAAEAAGLFVEFRELRDKILDVLYQSETQQNALSAHCRKQDTALDIRISFQLQELKAQTGRALELSWLGENGFVKGLYRGVILEMDDSLRVIDCEGLVLRPEDAEEGSEIPLGKVLERIDEAGGYEEERTEEPADSQIPRHQAAVL
jgi:hypothetical protein